MCVCVGKGEGGGQHFVSSTLELRLSGRLKVQEASANISRCEVSRTPPWLSDFQLQNPQYRRGVVLITEA